MDLWQLVLGSVFAQLKCCLIGKCLVGTDQCVDFEDFLVFWKRSH